MISSEALTELRQILLEDFGKKYDQEELSAIAEDLLSFFMFLTDKKHL